MLSVLGFLVILAPLVIVHEFGHFFFAKLFNVKAEAFSVGFGPRIWARYFGETEFRLSLIPLGGYVKLLGEEPGVDLPEAEKARSLQHQTRWRRFFIFFGGPLFNFIFAILVFMAILVIGEPQLASVVGRVVQGSVAEQSGFVSGDRVVSVDGEPVRKFNDLAMVILDHPGKNLSFEIQRGEQSLTLQATPVTEDGYSIYGESKPVGKIDGLMPVPRAAVVGVSNPKSPAGLLGVRTGDKITELLGQKITDWEQLEREYRGVKPGQSVMLKVVSKNNSTSDLTLVKPTQSRTIGEDWGLHSSELFVDQAMKGTPAAEAGLMSGDRLISIEGKTITSFEELRKLIQVSAKKTGQVQIAWERDGKSQTVAIKPTESKERDHNLEKTSYYTVGVVPMLILADPVMVVDRVWNPFVLLYKGTEKMVVFVWRNLVSIGKMFTGDVSVKTLGGPILIGKIAGDSLSRGLIAFLSTMAILSVGLGILNVLPVPVLDGGHMLLLGVEWLRGRPLSVRQTEVIQQVGLSLIILLMVVVMKNDLTRLPLFN